MSARSLCGLAVAALLAAPAPVLAAGASLTIRATNPLPLARQAETLEVSAADLASLGERNLSRIHIRDARGNEVLAQAVDTDYDELHRPDILIFQADFAASESREFTALVGARRIYKHADFKAHGRFVRERFDDFAWENDRIAHRTYGKALETWKGEPLTSSAIDIWSKRTPRMVIEDWYMVDDYHTDNGEGADFYSAGATRGGGGNGLWAADRLWVARGFVDSRVLANGPIRVLFELVYDAFDVNGTPVSEVKRISLDAGSQFDRFESRYQSKNPLPFTSGIGLKKTVGDVSQYDANGGWLAKWEPVEKNSGSQGIAVIVADPQSLEGQTSDERNLLLLAKAPQGVVSYWAGFAWDRAGKFTTFNQWRSHVQEFAQRVRAPVRVTVTPAAR